MHFYNNTQFKRIHLLKELKIFNIKTFGMFGLTGLIFSNLINH
jgi:hypothetical protein